ncbi:MAG: hypothetical protein ABIQ62_06855 [Thermomonas sp.]
MTAMLFVYLFAIYLVGLGLLAWIVPAFATRFLLGFAASASSHYIELAARLAVGSALVLHAPRMLYASVFSMTGWIILVTTAALLLVPWHWHRRFASKAVPLALPYLNLIGLASLLSGAAVLAAVVLA